MTAPLSRVRRTVARHPSWSAVVASLVASVAVTLAVLTAQRSAQASPGQAPPDELVERGRQLFVTGCSSCHGIDGRGLRAPNGAVRGPSLEHSGEAAAYYYLHTGRMPLANSEDLPLRHQPAYGNEDTRALVAYVGSLGDGPSVPAVSTSKGNLTDGGEIFRGNCAACHSASGAGGALSYGRAAPALSQATPKVVGSAVRVGPGQMPRFGADTIDDHQLDSVARYVEYLRHPSDPGGLALGRIGPIPEGFLIWIFGMGLLLVTVSWIGKRDRPTPAGAMPDGEMSDEKAADRR